MKKASTPRKVRMVRKRRSDVLRVREPSVWPHFGQEVSPGRDSVPHDEQTLTKMAGAEPVI